MRPGRSGSRRRCGRSTRSGYLIGGAWWQPPAYERTEGKAGGSEPPRLAEGVVGVGGDDEVVEDADVDEPERLREAPRERVVRVPDLGDARGVIAEEHHGGRVGLDHDAGDLTRVHGAAVDGAAEEDLGANQPSARIEQEDAEDLVPERRDLEAEVLPRELGGREYRGAAAEVLCDERAGVVEDLGGGGVAELIPVADKECVSHGPSPRE